MAPWELQNRICPAETALGLPSAGLSSVTVSMSKTIVLGSSETESGWEGAFGELLSLAREFCEPRPPPSRSLPGPQMHSIVLTRGLE